MSDGFDPYHKWLAIPPRHQPPNHYRLLGVEAFESDVDVINAAASQRIAYIQSLTVGPETDRATSLIRELTEAWGCLQDPTTKAVYDQQLRETTRSREPTVEPPPATTPPRTPTSSPKPVPQPPTVDAKLPRAEPVPPPTDGHSVAGPPPLPSDAVPPVSKARETPLVIRPEASPTDMNPSQRGRRTKGKSPLLMFMFATAAVLALLGIAFLLVGDFGKRPVAKGPRAEDKKSSEAATTDVTPPAKSARTKTTNTQPAANPFIDDADQTADTKTDAASDMRDSVGRDGEIVADVMIDLASGQFQQARERLLEALESGDTQTRSWARTLLEELDFATSDFEAKKTLQEATDEQLERMMRTDWLPEAADRLSYPTLRQRFRTALQEHLPAEFQRRQTAASRPMTEPSENGESPVAKKSEEESAKPTVPQSPTELLASRGLKNEGGFWILKDDDHLKGVALELNGMERNFRKLDADWNEIRQAHHQRLLQLHRARDANQQGAVKQIQAQLGVGRGVLARWMRLRSEFTIAVLAAMRKVEQQAEKYQQLNNDIEVQTALSKLDPAKHRLGPTQAFEQNLRRIGEYAEFLLTDRTLIYWSEEGGDAFVVDVILNERTAALLTVRPKATYSLIPEHVLREAGIEVETDEGRDLNIGGVAFFAPEVSVPSLRIGQFVVRNVRVSVLPAAMRRLNGFLCRDAFSGLNLTTHTAENVLTIQPAD